MELQVSVQSLLNKDERETDHSDWYEPKLISFKEFLDEIKVWLKDEGDDQNTGLNPGPIEQEVNTAQAGSHVGAVGPQGGVSQAAQKATSVAGSDTVAEPPSKLSKAPSNTSKASSKQSKTSHPASIAHIQAEVERAALKAQANALQEKHALEFEEAQLKARKETNLAIADAKVQVFTSTKP